VPPRFSASVHAHQRRAALRHECSTVAVMHVRLEETARLQFTRNGDVVLVYLGRRSAAAAVALPPPSLSLSLSLAAQRRLLIPPSVPPFGLPVFPRLPQ